MAIETTIIETILRVTGLDQINSSFARFGEVGSKAFDSVAASATKATAPMTAVGSAIEGQVAPLAAVGAAADAAAGGYDRMALSAVSASAVLARANKAFAESATALSVVNIATRTTTANQALTQTQGAGLAAAAGLNAAGKAARDAEQDFTKAAISVKEIRQATSVAKPIVTELGGSLGALGGIVRAGRAGIIGIAAAIGGVLVAAMEAAANKADEAQRSISGLLALGQRGGAGLGATAFKGIQDSATAAGLDVVKLTDNINRLIQAAQQAQASRGIGLSVSETQVKAIQDAVVNLTKLFQLGGGTESNAQKAINELLSGMLKVNEQTGKFTGLTVEGLNKIISTSPAVGQALINIVAPFTKTYAEAVTRLNQTPASVAKIVGGLSKMGEAIDEQAKKVGVTLPQAFEHAQNSAQNFLAQLSQTTGIGGIGTAIDAAAKSVDNLTKAMANNAALKDFFTGLKGVGEALATVGGFLLQNIPVIKTLQDAFSFVGGAVFDVIAAFGKLLSASGGLSGLFDSVAKTAKQTWNDIVDGANKGVNSIIDFFSNLPERVQSAIGKIPEALGVVWDAAVAGAKNRVDAMVDLFVNFPGRVAAAMQDLNAKISEALKRIPDSTRQIGTEAAATFEEGWRPVPDAIAKIMEDGAKPLGDRIKEAIKPGFDALKTNTTDAAKKTTDELNKIPPAAQNAGSALDSAFKQSTSSINKANQGISSLYQKLGAGIPVAERTDEQWSALYNTFAGIERAGVDFPANPFANLPKADIIVKPLTDGADALQKLGEQGKKTAEDLSQAGTKFAELGTGTEDIATKLATNLVDPIKEATSKIAEASTGTGEQVVKNIVEPMGQLPADVGQAASGVTESLTQPFKSAESGIQQVLDEIVAKTRAAMDQINQLTQGAGSNLTQLAGGFGGGGGGGGGGGDVFVGATGGLLGGKPGVDTNLGWFSAGEFMMQKRATDFWGLGFMHMINQMRKPDVLGALLGGARRFRLGGAFDGFARSLPAPGAFGPALIPAYAKGGPTDRRVAVDFRVGGQMMGTVHTSEATARNLEALSSHSKIVSTGASPNWRR